jgi:hypothetical protein
MKKKLCLYRVRTRGVARPCLATAGRTTGSGPLGVNNTQESDQVFQKVPAPLPFALLIRQS